MTGEDQRAEQALLRPSPGWNVSAIYFLSDGENVIYVGQSRNVKRRLARHSIDYVYAWYEPCKPNDLDRLETEAMRTHASPHLLNQNANGRA